MKVSVILPIYKVEQYIGECVRSLSRQTFRDFEVVLVDDGSPDQSIEIAEGVCNECGLRYQTVRQENRGVSAARNSGIRNANGEYVVMIDSDDLVTPDFLEKLTSEADETDGSVVFCDFKVVSEKDKFDPPRRDNGVITYNPKVAQELFLYHKVKFLLPTLFAKREFLVHNNVWFDETVRYSEDVQFIWKALAVASKIIYIDSDMYNYLLHPGSTMTSSGVTKILTGFNGIDRVYDEFYKEKYDASELVRREFLGSWKFAAIHGAAKMLDYGLFSSLLAQSGIDAYYAMFRGSSSPKIKCVGYILTVSKRIGYNILRKF